MVRAQTRLSKSGTPLRRCFWLTAQVRDPTAAARIAPPLAHLACSRRPVSQPVGPVRSPRSRWQAAARLPKRPPSSPPTHPFETQPLAKPARDLGHTDKEVAVFRFPLSRSFLDTGKHLKSTKTRHPVAGPAPRCTESFIGTSTIYLEKSGVFCGELRVDFALLRQCQGCLNSNEAGGRGDLLLGAGGRGDLLENAERVNGCG